MQDDEIWETFDEEQQSFWIGKIRDYAKSIDERIVKADPLNSVGRLLTKQDGELKVIPEDYTGDPTAFTGYFIFQAENWDEAEEIAGRCPTLDFGGRIQLRAVGH
jgi:hypothetical protein